LNRNVDISGNLNIKGNLAVFQQQNNSIINTTVNNYEILSTKDISLNGNLVVSGDVSLNNKLFVNKDVSFNGNLVVGGSIVVTNNVTANAFRATSDYRIKDQVISLADCSFVVDPLRPVTYHNKVTNLQDIGLIAHEVQEHFPFMVTGTKDGDDNQSVNYTSLIGLLIHEIKVLKHNQIQPDVIPNLQKHIQNLEERLRLLEK
jgi:predicted acyltransferase (DUF342 family)